MGVLSPFPSVVVITPPSHLSSPSLSPSSSLFWPSHPPHPPCEQVDRSARSCSWPCRSCQSSSLSPSLLLPVSTPRAVAHGGGWGCCCAGNRRGRSSSPFLAVFSRSCPAIPSRPTHEPPHEQWLVGLGASGWAMVLSQVSLQYEKKIIVSKRKTNEKKKTYIGLRFPCTVAHSRCCLAWWRA